MRQTFFKIFFRILVKVFSHLLKFTIANFQVNIYRFINVGETILLFILSFKKVFFFNYFFNYFYVQSCLIIFDIFFQFLLFIIHYLQYLLCIITLYIIYLKSLFRITTSTFLAVSLRLDTCVYVMKLQEFFVAKLKYYKK